MYTDDGEYATTYSALGTSTTEFNMVPGYTLRYIAGDRIIALQQ